MKKTVLGICAHVDAGKTTLAEAMLVRCGKIRKAGDNSYYVWVKEKKNTETAKVLIVEADGEKMLVTDSITL